MALTKWQCGKCGLLSQGPTPTPKGPCPGAQNPSDPNATGNTAPTSATDPNIGSTDHSWVPVS